MSARLRSLVVALGVGQIVSWGPLFYSMAVLWPSVGETFGVSRVTLFGVVSLALLLNGLVAPFAGRMIDLHGGRVVMSIGSLLSGLGLAIVASAESVAVYALGWGIGGVAMSMVLYDPAFATLSQHSGDGHRRALTAVTLLGGLASTVFWPLTESLLGDLGWRGAFWVFAILQWTVCLPLHVFVIPSRPPTLPLPTRGEGGASPVASAQQLRVFRWLTAGFALHAFLMSALAVNLLTLLQSRGLTLADAVFAGVLMGPMQVAGRLVDMFMGGRIPARVLGIGALCAVVLSMLLLSLPQLSLAMALVMVSLYGAGNGLITIAKGMNVADIFGRADYGYWLGRLARWVYGMYAVAPLAYALLHRVGIDDGDAPWLLAAFVIAALVCYVRATGAIPQSAGGAGR